MLQEELKALGTILTPEQREKVKELGRGPGGAGESRPESRGCQSFAARDTLAERAESAAEKIGLTSEQRKQIIKTLSSHADRHAALKAKCREPVKKSSRRSPPC